DVEAIEIIRNPSARYDAAGSGGIINIKLKKNKNYGLNGSLTSSYGIGIYSKYSNGLRLNYRNKQVNVFANYTYSNGINESWMKLYREQNDSIYDQRSTNTSHYNGQTIKAGMDYFINKKNTLGVMVSFFGDRWNDFNHVATPILSITGKIPGRVLLADNHAAGDKQNTNLNFNHHYSDSSGRDWNMDIDYGRFTTAQQSLQPNIYFSADLQTSLEERSYAIATARSIDLFTWKADYEQPLLGGRISGGAKLSFVTTHNNFQFSQLINGSYQVDNGRSNSFALTENIYAAYLAFQRKLKKWDVQAGLRMENTYTDGRLEAVVTQADNRVKRNYTDLFPSLAVAYTLNKNNSLNLNYSRRINRPGYQSLNPFESKLDELTYQKGNPFLKPEYTQSVSMTHTYKYKLNSSIGYARTIDFSAQITDTIEGKRNFIQQRNAGVQENVYINISYPFSIASWWSVYVNAGANRLSNKVNLGPALVSHLAVFSYNLYAQHTIVLPFKYTLEVSGFYNAPTLWGGTFVNKSFWGLDAGLQKKWLKDKLTVKLSVSDIFKSMHWQGISRFGGLYMDASGGWESRQLKINGVYRFGKKEIRAQRNRSTGSDVINKRV
ncbi:MAG TPA: TonB-dependent receptor, partial [Chitinophagaceae bacterium]|nr:TonB-dependent receptor [Chitinophagaceae bacterium]